MDKSYHIQYENVFNTEYKMVDKHKMVDNITSGSRTLFSGKSQTLKHNNDNDRSRWAPRSWWLGMDTQEVRSG